MVNKVKTYMINVIKKKQNVNKIKCFLNNKNLSLYMNYMKKE